MAYLLGAKVPNNITDLAGPDLFHVKFVTTYSGNQHNYLVFSSLRIPTDEPDPCRSGCLLSTIAYL